MWPLLFLFLLLLPNTLSTLPLPFAGKQPTPPPNPASPRPIATDSPLRFAPDLANAGTADTEWVHWVVVSAEPTVSNDTDRARFLSEFDPDVMDWYGGQYFNRGDFARSRGIACAAAEEYEYEESLQFAGNDTLRLFADNGMSRTESNQCATYSEGHYCKVLVVDAFPHRHTNPPPYVLAHHPSITLSIPPLHNALIRHAYTHVS